jgi:hypothetical protein
MLTDCDTYQLLAYSNHPEVPEVQHEGHSENAGWIDLLLVISYMYCIAYILIIWYAATRLSMAAAL